MKEVSTVRLYLLRGMYLLMVVGLGATIWPQIFHHTKAMSLWHGVGCSMLGAVSILALIGLRYPLKMLPVLFFELIWKIIWITAIALPLWRSNELDANHLGTLQDCSVAILIPLIMPWSYVWENYVKAKSDNWRKSS